VKIIVFDGRGFSEKQAGFAYSDRRVHPPTAQTPIPPNQKIAIFDSSLITIKTPIKT
jgi:hypothetical protein